MRRLAFSLLTVLLLAACAGAPQKTSRGSGSSVIAANGAYRAPPPGFPNFVDHSIGREEISIQAMSLVGVPYRWGGNTPDSGFDCSGLVRYVVARAASVNLPRTTADMSGRGESVEPDEIAPGDLIFFNTTGRPHSHVGIYVGKLRFVNAPSTGGTVRLDYLTNPYWAKRFDGIRRVAAPAAKPTPFDAPNYQAAAPQPERAAGLAAASAYGGGQAAGASAYGSAQAGAVGAPATAARSAASYAASPSPSQNSARAAVAAEPRAPSTATTDSALATLPATRAPQADPFEPPPPGMSAAQLQARAAGAISPTPTPPAQASAYDGSAAAPLQTTAAARSAPRTASAGAPDPIDAAADAFEPPPPASVAARQARLAQQSQHTQQAPLDQQAEQPRTADGAVQIMRASTASRSVPAPSQTNDDPIARFANGNF
ncbi:C40 family peptidase [Burkholderia sp. WSM2230]|uniref:C40 family peptidase n=1 Tax=Burkholderia sp. WSM2230 TaxID=944435 RepID=UPI0004213CA3|nr:C40 family peptidase [Burkholderia sp. WSM2230]